MANVNSLTTGSSSATSSLYGTRNVLSGLASGMDTEAMIENSVSGYKTKITQLQQQQTKYEWKQDAYRSITDKLYTMNQAYTSYTSKTNLMSNAFFNSAVTTSVTGAAANLGKVSATGKSSSDIEILAAQTATAARYAVSSSAIYGASQKTGSEITATSADLDGQTLNVTFNGVTKAIKIDADELGYNSDGVVTAESLASYLNAQIVSKFGSGNVTFTSNSSDNSLSVSAASDSSTLKVTGASSALNDALGIDGGLTNYLDTSKSISDLLGTNALGAYAGQKGDATGLTQKTNSDGNAIADLFTDSDGNYYKKLSDSQYVLSDSNGNPLRKLTINDADIQVSENASLSSVMNSINSSEAGVNVSYSQLTKQFVFTAKDTGAAGKIDFGAGLAQNLFTASDPAQSSNIPGRDAQVVANVNGERVELTRASNTIDMDGLSVNLKDSFGDVNNASAADAVSFKTTSDADSIYKTVKEFIDSYNAILKEVHDAYATQPAEKSSSTHAKYEPLTDDDKATMSETAIKSYEEKAKQGLLFGDSDLSALYSKLVGAFSTGSNAADLRAMGISTSYSSNLTQIKLDESKLRSVLESDPDKVRDAFTKSKEGGASSDGLMTSIKNTLEQYASTSIASPGVLVKKAGSTFSSTSLLSNTVQKQIDSVQTQIEKWQTKMSSKIDYYTRQFTALEKLMNTMNSQSSALSGLMGG